MPRSQNNYLAKIPEKWLLTKGSGVKIGICDTTCNVSHSAVKHAIAGYKSFGNSPALNHGTHIVGIIVAKPNDVSVMTGLASEVKVIMAGFSTTGGRGYKFVGQALDWLEGYDIDVLNLSFAYLEDNAELRDRLKKMSEKTLIVAAYSQVLKYPHSYKEIISVGLEGDEAEIITDGSFVSTARVNNCYKNMHGSSMAAAFVSSVGCLAKAHDKNINKKSFLANILGSEKLCLTKKKNMVKHGDSQVNITF